MPLPLPRPCVVCQRLTEPGRSRCREHLAEAAVLKRQRRSAAPGTNAQQRLRRNLNLEGVGVCSLCGVMDIPENLNVDHRLALADGGLDVLSNVWVLCIPCHKEKSAKEATRRAQQR